MHSVVNRALVCPDTSPEQGGGRKAFYQLKSTSAVHFFFSLFYYLKGNCIKQIRIFYLVLFHCGKISLMCLQWFGCATS